MDEKELLRQQIERVSMALAERDAALTAERALRTAAVVGTKTMELNSDLASWVAAEQSLEVMAGSSAERDAEYMTAEVLTVVFGDAYLAAARTLGGFIEAATPPGVTMQQHALRVETLGDGEPPESILLLLVLFTQNSSRNHHGR